MDSCGRGYTRELRICAEQTALCTLHLNIRQQVFSHTLSSFHTDLQAFSERFSQNGFDLFTKGKLSSLVVHNGISLRKSDEEESVSGLTWQNEMLFSLARRHMAHTHNPYSPHICHSHTHIVALILLMNNRVHLLHVHLMFVTCVTF